MPDLLYHLVGGTDVLAMPAWAQQGEILLTEEALFVQGKLEAIFCPGTAQITGFR